MEPTECIKCKSILLDYEREASEHLRLEKPLCDRCGTKAGFGEYYLVAWGEQNGR